MMEQNSKEKKPLENDKENMRNYIQQLETSSELSHNIKNFSNLSQRQQKRRMQALGTRDEYKFLLKLREDRCCSAVSIHCLINESCI